jgi:hypothetical protein
MMKDVALCLLWQNGDEGNPQKALELSAIVPRVYIVDRRERAEGYASLVDPRLHYAPFRQNVSLGTALNRALNLAHEEGRLWLWIFDTVTFISPAQLEFWSLKASIPVALYLTDASQMKPKLLRRPSCGLLVAVSVAHSLGGWDPTLPAQLVFPDFYERFKAAGETAETGIQLQEVKAGRGFDPWETGRSLCTLMQQRFSRKR